MKSVGIDIGSSHIKVVEIQSTSKGFQVLSYQIHALTRPPGSDQDIEIIEYLRELSSRFDPTATRFAFAIRQDRVAIRNKIFPFRDRIKINKSLAFELEEDIPFSSDSAVFDAKIVQYHGNSTEILACAVPNQHIKNLLQLLSDGNIAPYVVSTEGVAFANIFEKWNEVPPQFPPINLELEESGTRRNRPISIVLNIGHTRTLVCAFEAYQLVGVRSILWGGAQIVDAIAKKYNLPPKEAQKEMESKAFILHTQQEANYEAKIFSDLIAKNVRDLARDLQLVLLEFGAEFNGQIQRVDMTGGVSMIQGLGPFLTQLLEVPVNRIPTLNNFPNVFFEKSDLTQSRLSIALGLAVEALRKPRNPAVNFLKGVFAKQSNAARLFWQNWGSTLQWTGALVLVLFAWTMTRDHFADALELAAKANLRQQAKNVAGLTGKAASEARIKDYIRSNNKRAEDIRKIISLANMNSAMEVFKKVNDAAPSKSSTSLDVRLLNIQDNRVLMEGYVASPKELTLLQQALVNAADDGHIQVVKSTLPPWKNKTTFALAFQVDRNIQKGTQE
jgi:general secretion pathway protein L